MTDTIKIPQNHCCKKTVQSLFVDLEKEASHFEDGSFEILGSCEFDKLKKKWGLEK